MNLDSEYADQITKFESYVSQYFRFLESEYHLEEGKLRKHGFSDPRDAFVSIRYKGNPVDVEIGWGIGTASIGINLRDNDYSVTQRYTALKLGIKPVKVVNFESAVEYITEGKEISVIPEISKNISFKKMQENAELRQHLIKTSMEDTIKKLADKLKKYGEKFIQGNTEQFPEFDKYYIEKYY